MAYYQFPDTSSSINIDDHLNDFLLDNNLQDIHLHVWPEQEPQPTDDMDYFRGKWGFYHNVYVAGIDSAGNPFIPISASVRILSPIASVFGPEYLGGPINGEKVFLYPPFPSASYEVTEETGYYFVGWKIDSPTGSLYSTELLAEVPYSSSVESLYAVFGQDCALSASIDDCTIVITSSVLPTPTPSPTPSISLSVTPSLTAGVSSTPTPSLSISNTATITVTPSITPSLSISNTPSITPSLSISSTPSVTPSITPSITKTPSITPSLSISNTPSITPSLSISATPSITPTNTPVSSITPTISVTPTVTNTPTVTRTPSITASISFSATPTKTITNTVTASITPSLSISSTPSITPSLSISSTPSITPSLSISNTASITPSLSISNTPSITPSLSISNTPSITPSLSISSTQTPSVTASITPSLSISNTPTVTRTASVTPSLSISKTPSITPSISISNTPSITPTNSITPSISVSSTPSITPTSSITPSLSISSTPTNTPTVTRTASITPSLSISSTPSITPSISVSNTPSITPSLSISNTPTITRTPSITPSLSISRTPSITPTRSVTPSLSISSTPAVTNSTTPTPTVTKTPSITPSITPSPSTPYFAGADYLIFTYYFPSGSGTDLDTRTTLVTPITDGPFGYFDGPANKDGTYLHWGGDNTGIGVESVWVDVAKLETDLGSFAEVELTCKALWYSSRGTGDINMTMEAYAGGTVSAAGFGFTCSGTYLGGYTFPTVNVVTVSQNAANLECVGTYTYRMSDGYMTKIDCIEPSPTPTPSVTPTRTVSPSLTPSPSSDVTAPSIPTGVTATQYLSTERIDVNWNDSTDSQTGVAYYEVWRNTDGGAYSLISTDPVISFYIDTAVTLDTTYCYKIKAVDNVGNVSGLSAEACENLPPPPTPSPTKSPTRTPSLSVSSTPAGTPPGTPPVTPTRTPSLSISSTPTPTPSVTRTPSLSISSTPTPTRTTTPIIVSPTRTPSLSVSSTPTFTPTKTVTPSISVSPVPCYALTLGYDLSSNVDACFAATETYYSSDELFNNASTLYIFSNCTSPAPAGYYADNALGRWRYWNGSAFGTSGFC